jgi:hypothetical protein
VFETDEQRPNLPPWVTADLVAHAVDFTGDFPRYGQPLPELLEGTGWSWLEAAVLAGYVPHLEGTALAIRGSHAITVQEITESLAKGADGDAIGWTQQADHYREIIALLEDLVIELEQWSEEINSRRHSDLTNATKARWAEDADAAHARASNARQRQASALADNRSAEEARARYGLNE